LTNTENFRFSFLVLDIYQFDWELSTKENRELLIAMEQNYLDSIKPRYNISPTAGSSLDVTRSIDTRAKIRAAFIGIPLTEEHRLSIIKGMQHRFKPVYFYDEAANLVTIYMRV
jgi:hypothetical protein